MKTNIELAKECGGQAEKDLAELNGESAKAASRLSGKLAAKKQKLKLFVWEGFSPDYTKGLAFAIAKDETEARKLIEKERGYKVYKWGDLTICPIKRIAKCVSGGG